MFVNECLAFKRVSFFIGDDWMGWVVGLYFGGLVCGGGFAYLRGYLKSVG